MDWIQVVNSDDPLFFLAIVLLSGIIGGEIFASIRLPKVTGWIATGIVLRSFLVPVLSSPEQPFDLDAFRPVMSFVLGFIAFTVGATLYLSTLRNAGKRIGFLLLGEATLTPLIVGGLLLLIGPWVGEMTWKPALLLATIAIAGAPGTTVLVIQEARARGTLTRTLVAVVGLIDMVAVGVFVFVSTDIGTDSTWWQALGRVSSQFLVTLLIGSGWAMLALVLIRYVVSPAFLGPTMVAVILGAWGSASGFGTSGGILACTFAGIVVTNLRHEAVRSTEAYLHSIGGVLFALFFTLAGTRLDFSLVPKALGLVLLYFAARLVAKIVTSWTAMSLAGMPDNVRRYLGLALMPHGGVAVGLILLVQAAPGFDERIDALVTTVGLSALAINQLLGPSATRFALNRAGEDYKDRPQLLDFLQEQRITVDLQGKSREDVIRSLAALMYSTYDMSIDQESFVQQVLRREAQETTCLGRGLMIPHAILDEGDEVRGVLGLSASGLDLGAPDGQRVHAVLLLATPASERDHHLEVLAAFAAAITRDDYFCEQLYHARSAAHAYDILHHEDQEDLNYFLEDAAVRAGLRDGSD